MTAIPVNVLEAEQVAASFEFDLPWACGTSLYRTLGGWPRSMKAILL
jgi:hypothetical protein